MSDKHQGDGHDREDGKGGHEKGHKKHKKHAHHGGGHAEHEEGVPEWVVSFADNVLLQMGFFVILLALNMGAKATGPSEPGPGTPAKSAEDALIDLAIAVRSGFNSPVDMASTAPEDQALIRRLLERSSGEPPRPSGAGVEEDGKQQSIRPSEDETDGAFVEFEEREHALNANAKTITANIARKVVGTKWMVEIRGHASSRESFGDTERGRKLSYDRAMETARVLVAGGLKWEQLRVVACGDIMPVTTMRGRNVHLSNQRAEIIVLRELMPEDRYSQE